jgi:hypothetical protein
MIELTKLDEDLDPLLLRSIVETHEPVLTYFGRAPGTVASPALPKRLQPSSGPGFGAHV